MSLRYPRDLIENVIVNLEGCHFPFDFLILGITSPRNFNDSTIILGHPFLDTTKANINCKRGGVEISYGKERVPLTSFQEIKDFEDTEKQGDNEE